MFKSTFKLLLNNFSMVWKILLYKLIVFVCVLGLTTVVSLPIINQLINQDFFVYVQENISNIFLNFNLNNLIDIAVAVIQNFWKIVTDANLIPLTIIVGVLAVIAYYFISGLYRLAVVDDVHAFMSSNLKLGFMNCYISNFGKSIKLQLIKLPTEFLLDAIIIFSAGFMYYGLAQVALAIAPLLTMIYVLVMFSLKITLIAGVETALIANNVGFIKAIKNNFKAIKRKFITIFSNTLMLLTIILFLNMFALFFTFGATLILTLPISSLLLVIFKNVVYYECTGMRYYNDSDTIMMPKKLEEQDKFSRVKDII